MYTYWQFSWKTDHCWFFPQLAAVTFILFEIFAGQKFSDMASRGITQTMWWTHLFYIGLRWFRSGSFNSFIGRRHDPLDSQPWALCRLQLGLSDIINSMFCQPSHICIPPYLPSNLQHRNSFQTVLFTQRWLKCKFQLQHVRSSRAGPSVNPGWDLLAVPGYPSSALDYSCRSWLNSYFTVQQSMTFNVDWCIYWFWFSAQSSLGSSKGVLEECFYHWAHWALHDQKADVKNYAGLRGLSILCKG